MKRLETSAINKEKMIFLAAACGLAAVVYGFIVSAPAPLLPDQPIARVDLPDELKTSFNHWREREEFYVVDGITPERQPAVEVNRKRKTPFAPVRDYVPQPPDLRKPLVDTPVRDRGIKPPSQPPVIPVRIERAEIEPVDIASRYDYLGIVMRDGETVGLLKPKDGTTPRRVKPGDRLIEDGFTVGAIEKQAIRIVHVSGRPFELTTSFGRRASD